MEYLKRLTQSLKQGSRISTRISTGNTDLNPTNNKAQETLSTQNNNAAVNFIVISGNLYKLNAFSAGGICHIYKAQAASRKLPVLSVKMIKPRWARYASVRRQFNIEGQILSGLSHPQLPHFTTRGTHKEHVFLAYKFLPGVPLIKLAQNKTLFGENTLKPLALSILTQILDQLNYLHNKINPVVHGDISSENIIINNSQQVSLADFGCAHFTNTRSNHSFRWLAKPSYLSPEQARGDPWGPASDIYQTAILFYEMITGKRWIKGKTPREKMLYAASISKPAPDFLGKIIHKHLSSIIADMLDPNPKTRQQNLALIFDQLEAFGSCSAI